MIDGLRYVFSILSYTRTFKLINITKLANVHNIIPTNTPLSAVGSSSSLDSTVGGHKLNSDTPHPDSDSYDLPWGEEAERVKHK